MGATVIEQIPQFSVLHALAFFGITVSLASVSALFTYNAVTFIFPSLVTKLHLLVGHHTNESQVNTLIFDLSKKVEELTVLLERNDDASRQFLHQILDKFRDISRAIRILKEQGEASDTLLFSKLEILAAEVEQIRQSFSGSIPPELQHTITLQSGISEPHVVLSPIEPTQLVSPTGEQLGNILDGLDTFNFIQVASSRSSEIIGQVNPIAVPTSVDLSTALVAYTYPVVQYLSSNSYLIKFLSTLVTPSYTHLMTLGLGAMLSQVAINEGPRFLFQVFRSETAIEAILRKLKR